MPACKSSFNALQSSRCLWCHLVFFYSHKLLLKTFQRQAAVFPCLFFFLTSLQPPFFPMNLKTQQETIHESSSLLTWLYSNVASRMICKLIFPENTFLFCWCYLLCKKHIFRVLHIATELFLNSLSW